MVKTFMKFLKNIYLYYLQAILFIAGFVVLNIACYCVNTILGLFATAVTLILFGVILNYDQQNFRKG